VPIIIKGEKCPFLYYEEMVGGYEHEFCKIDGSECSLDCPVYKEIRKKSSKKSFEPNGNPGEILGFAIGFFAAAGMLIAILGL